MDTQSTIVREYATGMVDGFLNDLALAGERKQGPTINSQDDLIEAFRAYVQSPESLFQKAA